MTSFQSGASRSPWLTVWLSPRQTIDDVLASRSRRLVWLLSGLSTIAAFISQLFFRFGFANPLLSDWRVWIGLIFGGAALGIIIVYLSALVLDWFGRRLGGQASTPELRAVVAWSTLPSIVGVVAVLPLLAAWRFLGAGSSVAPSGLSISAFAILILSSLWAFALFLAMLSRVQRFGMGRAIATYVLSSILALLIPLLMHTFLFQFFSIPAASMAPTLTPGDYVLVSKYDYGYSHYSLPLSLPLFSGRIFDSPPVRGDVVVFRSPKDDSEDFVKRILGLPGDRVQMKAGALYINNVQVPRVRLPDITEGDLCSSDSITNVKRWRETLPNGVSYETLDCVENGFYDNTDIYTVPNGHFFMMGDNRDNSTDSRVLSYFGYVPFDNIVGRVRMTYHH